MITILVGWAIFGLMLSPIMFGDIIDIIDWLKDKRDKGV